MVIASELVATLQMLIARDGDRICYDSNDMPIEQILVQETTDAFPEDKQFTFYSEGDDIPQ